MFYEQLKKACKNAGTSPTALAKEFELSTANTGAWKHGGHPSPEILKKFALRLKVTTDYLLGIENPAARDEPPVRETIKRAHIVIDMLYDDEVNDVLKYAEFVKSQRKQ